MKKKLVCFFLLILTLNPVIGLTQTLKYQKLIGNPLALDSIFEVYNCYQDYRKHIYINGISCLVASGGGCNGYELEIDNMGAEIAQRSYKPAFGGFGANLSMENLDTLQAVKMGVFQQNGMLYGFSTVYKVDGNNQLSAANIIGLTDSSQVLCYAYHLVNSGSGVYVTGHYDKYPTNINADEFFIARLDSASLNLQWALHYSAGYEDNVHGITASADGGVVVYGHTLDSTQPLGNLYDAFMMKVDSNGVTEWIRKYDSGTSRDILTKVILLKDSGFLLTGHKGTAVQPGATFIIKTDSTGNMEWNKSYQAGIYVGFQTVTETNDGGYAAAGGIFTGPDNAWLLKVDSMGTVQWNYAYQQYAQSFNDIYQMSDGGYLGTGNNSTSTNQGYLTHVIKTDSLGVLGCGEVSYPTVEYSNTMMQDTLSFTVDTAGLFTYPASMILASANISETVQCGSTGGVINLTKDIADKFELWPNPAKEQITTVHDFKQNAILHIYDVTGKQVFRKTLNTNTTSSTFSVSFLQSGIYIVEASDEAGNTVRRKLVKQ